MKYLGLLSILILSQSIFASGWMYAGYENGKVRYRNPDNNQSLIFLVSSPGFIEAQLIDRGKVVWQGIWLKTDSLDDVLSAARVQVPGMPDFREWARWFFP